MASIHEPQVTTATLMHSVMSGSDANTFVGRTAGEHANASLERIAVVGHATGDRFINVGFLCALSILAAIAAFSYSSIASFIEREAAVARSHQVVETIERVLAQMRDAETGYRGFLLTSNEQFLQPYFAAKNSLGPALRDLRETVASRSAQGERFDELRARVAKTLALIDSIVEAEPEVWITDTQTRLENAQRMMDAVREVAAIMLANERALLARHAEESRLSARKAIAIIVLGNLVSFGLLTGGFIVLRRENALRARAEREMMAANEGLEQGIKERTLELAETNQQLNLEIEGHRRAREEIALINAGLEAQVSRRTAQLEASNKELESFSYSVSHDLRSPLRAVDGFSRLLQEDYGDKLDEEGRRVIKLIRDNSQRMAQLIDDLLAFSRLGRAQINSAEVNMEALARESCDEVEQAASTQLTIKPMPPAWGDRALLRQVWVNLLQNAYKFSGKVAAPAVEAGGYADGEEHVYYVADNGVGFDMAYYDKLFGVFQRLHRAADFPGTGVGLAIVQRVVARHGGRVWAKSGIGEGATFYFALPKGA